MAYFKINKTGADERKGLVQVRFDCYLSRDDEGNEEHYVTVPDLTDAVYEGKLDGEGMPVDQKDFEAWIASLPTITRNNPFCCHFRCFEPDVTDEGLLKAGDEILAMSMKNWETRELRKNANPAVTFTTNIVKIQASLTRAETIKQTDFVTVATDNAIDSSVRA